MKLAFSTLACPKWTWNEILTNARSYGYDGLELRFICDERNLAKTPEMQPSRLAQTKRELTDAQLEIACVDTSCILTTADAAALELGCRLIDLAAELKSPVVRIFGGNLPKEASEIPRVMDFAAKNFRALAEYGKPLGVRPLLETHDDFTASSRVVELMKLTAHENAGVLWDTHHPFRFSGETVRETFQQLAPYTHHVHLKDSVPLPNNGYRYCLCGEGNVPVRECIELLRNNGYQGWLSVEWEKTWCPEIAEPEIALPQYADELRKNL